MSKYLTRISASKDEKAVAQAGLAETQAKLSTEQFIGTKKSEIANVTAAYEAALGANPFKIENAVALQKEKAALELELTAASTILTTEF